MNVPINAGTSVSTSAMMDTWASQQDPGYNSQPNIYGPPFGNVPTRFALQGQYQQRQQQQQQQNTRPQQLLIPSSSKDQNNYSSTRFTNGFSVQAVPPQAAPGPFGAHWIQQQEIVGYNSMGPPPLRNVQVQDQSYQDEIESLMIGNDILQPMNVPSQQTWSHSQIVPEAISPVDFAGSLWQTPTPPPLIPAPNYQVHRNETPAFTQHSHNFGWSGEWKRNNPSEARPIQEPSTFMGRSSLAGPFYNPRTYQRALDSFGSYSDGSEIGRSFSPATPNAFSFGSYNNNVQLRRNSEECSSLSSFQGRGIENECASIWMGTNTEPKWAMAHEGIGPCIPQAQKQLQPVEVAMGFPQPQNFLPSQSVSNASSPTKVTDEIDFGSPEPEDDAVFELDTPASQPASEPRKRSSRSGRQSHAPRSSRDDLLIEMRLKGLPYKEIKAKCGYQEAESTLRGRFRTLTKPKIERVRRPGWTQKDCRLLGEAVVAIVGPDRASQARDQEATDRLNIAWKDVAQYIVENGGSYRFGNATCKKKWCEIQTKGTRV